jgi:hypothetical protein
MTWRAFFIGLLFSAVLNWSDIYGGMARLWGRMTESNFSTACVFALVVLTLGLNTLIKLVKRSAALKQAELMLVWCMVLVAGTVTTTGLHRFWLPMLAGPPYLAQRPETLWRETALQALPDALVLSKDPKSVAARNFYEASGGEGRVPWRPWLRPVIRWGTFWLAFYLAVLFLCALLRRQWVDRERLQFPLARVPLEFSEGSDGPGMLPTIFRSRAFVYGFLGAVAFRLLRSTPRWFGAASGWSLVLPMQDILAGTPLESARMVNVTLSWIDIGFAYLVPADVSLSVWLLYLFSRFEILAAGWTLSSYSGGSGAMQLLTWQQAGAYVAFTVGALYMCRRHFQDVLRKAFGGGRDVDDADEPVGLGVAFWGLVVCSGLVIAWLAVHKMWLSSAVAWLAVLMCIQIVHARIVSQSGVPDVWLTWDPADLVYGVTGGHFFGNTGVVIAQMQRRMLYSIPQGPAMMHCMKISSVFTKRRRLLAPILALVLVVSLGVSTWTYLHEAYKVGVVNFNDATWSGLSNVRAAFDLAHMKIQGESSGGDFAWMPLGLGIGLTSIIMYMRARFYWWPLYPVGLMACTGWYPDRIWLPFLVGWAIKVGVAKYVGGRALHKGRQFFIGLILAEASVSAVSTVIRVLTKGGTPPF